MAAGSACHHSGAKPASPIPDLRQPKAVPVGLPLHFPWIVT